MSEQASLPNPRRWWSLKEAAAYLEIGTANMYERAHRAARRYASKRTGMPVVRFGNKGPFKFPIEEFKRWAEHPVD
jgi:hypothetical protein